MAVSVTVKTVYFLRIGKNILCTYINPHVVYHVSIYRAAVLEVAAPTSSTITVWPTAYYFYVMELNEIGCLFCQMALWCFSEWRVKSTHWKGKLLLKWLSWTIRGLAMVQTLSNVLQFNDFDFVQQFIFLCVQSLALSLSPSLALGIFFSFCSLMYAAATEIKVISSSEMLLKIGQKQQQSTTEYKWMEVFFD